MKALLKALGNTLALRMPYSQEAIALVKGLGGVWSPRDALWLLPLQRLEHLPLEAFDLEEVIRATEALSRWKEAVREEGRRLVEGRETPLTPEQREDLGKVLRALLRSADGGPWGFLLANGTGTGKTYVYAAAAKAAERSGLRPLVVVPNEDIARQSGEVLRLFGLEGVEVVTYAKLEPERAFGRFLVLDEAHLAKNLSDRGRRARRAALRAAFVLFSTATPFDKPWESEYLLEPTGYLRFVRKDFRSFMALFRVYSRTGYGDREEYYFAGSVSDLTRFHETLKGTGFMTKRLFSPKEVSVAYEVPFLDIGREGKELLAEVRRRLKLAAQKAPPEERGLVMAQRTLLSRALLERYKLRAAFPLLKGLMEEGYRVLLFLQYRSEKVLDLSTPEAVEAFLEEGREKGHKGVLHRHLAPALEGLHLQLPSPLEEVRRELGHLGPALGFYTGEQTEGQLRRAKEAWDRGEVRLMVATAAKGGTGLSFHDTRGDLPTAQVVLTLPWTATQLDQVLGRVVRVGMKSDVRILLPASPVPFERKLALTIAQSLRTLGYAVRGGEGVVPESVVQAFLSDLAAVDPEGFMRLLAEEERGERALLV